MIEKQSGFERYLTHVAVRSLTQAVDFYNEVLGRSAIVFDGASGKWCLFEDEEAGIVIPLTEYEPAGNTERPTILTFQSDDLEGCRVRLREMEARTGRQLITFDMHEELKVGAPAFLIGQDEFGNSFQVHSFYLKSH